MHALPQEYKCHMIEEGWVEIWTGEAKGYTPSFRSMFKKGSNGQRHQCKLQSLHQRVGSYCMGIYRSLLTGRTTIPQNEKYLKDYIGKLAVCIYRLIYYHSSLHPFFSSIFLTILVLCLI